jgi:transketolase
MNADDRSTRDAYRDELAALLPTDVRVFCVDSDTGLFRGVDFAAGKDRYLNLGIAEHNLLGTAAGLAASGKLPYVTTMATFATTRALEVLKVDIAYPGLPVRIAGTHGGLAAGHLGPTHHALEDLGIVTMLPGFTVVVPADATQAALAVRQTAATPGPVYLRLGKTATPSLATDQPFQLGTVQRLRGGADVTILACGPHPVLAALRAAATLADQGVRAGVLNVHTLRPLDVPGILAGTAPAAAVITVEEHWRHGGLGSLVAEVLADHAPRRMARIGFPDMFVARVGDQADLLNHYGVTDARIVAVAHDLLEPPAGNRHVNGGDRHDPDLSRV